MSRLKQLQLTQQLQKLEQDYRRTFYIEEKIKISNQIEKIKNQLEPSNEKERT